MFEFDGVAPVQVEKVDSVGEVAELLAAQSAAGSHTVVPVGGGTALGIGNVIERVDLAIDLSGLRGIENYNPADLTLTARAGTTLEELQGELAQHGQELPIEAPFSDRATVGGLIATAFAGPRRYGFGTLKDALIGSSYVRGDGLVAKAGGMVVKNVSGFEMSRFLHGSWGTLAVITSANFKISPIPKADRTVSLTFGTTGDAVATFQRVLETGLRPSSAEIEASVGESILHLRFLGSSAGVDSQEAAFERGLDFSAKERRDAEASKAFWGTLGERWAATPADIVQIVAGVRPRDVGETIATLTDSETDVEVASMLVSPGTGTIRARFATDAVAPSDLWGRLAPLRTQTGGTAIVEFAAPDWRRLVDVWGPPPPSIAMMRALKREFDPNGLLNRGRMMI